MNIHKCTQDLTGVNYENLEKPSVFNNTHFICMYTMLEP